MSRPLQRYRIRKMGISTETVLQFYKIKQKFIIYFYKFYFINLNQYGILIFLFPHVLFLTVDQWLEIMFFLGTIRDYVPIKIYAFEIQ